MFNIKDGAEEVVWNGEDFNTIMYCEADDFKKLTQLRTHFYPTHIAITGSSPTPRRSNKPKLSLCQFRYENTAQP